MSLASCSLCGTSVPPHQLLDHQFSPECGNAADKRNAAKGREVSNINIARVADPDVEWDVNDMFSHHEWTNEQKDNGEVVRRILANAVLTIIDNVPPGPDRTVAIRKIREAAWAANSAITFGGKF